MRRLRLGCFGWLAALAICWALGAIVAKLLPLGDMPANASEQRYFDNAVEMRHYINNNPFAQLLTGLFVYRTSVSDLRHVPNSCDGGGDNEISPYRDVVARMTDHSLFGLPIASFATSCGGWSIQRGRPDYRPRPTPKPLINHQSGEWDQPVPPPPPPPGVRPPPAPSRP